MTTALTAEYRKVISARFVTKRDGSPMHCVTCGAVLVMGQAHAATAGDGWHSYCDTCAASFAGQVAGLYSRVQTLTADFGDDVPEAVVAAVQAATPAVQEFAADPESYHAFMAAKTALMAARTVVGQSKHAATVAAGLDLSNLPAGTYAVPGGDTRLKVKVEQGKKGTKWEGWTFVKDGAVYGESKRYGMQRPGQRYTGQVEDALRVILADVPAAAAAYGHLTGKCSFCNLPLELGESVARGYGRKCAENHGLPWG